MDEWSMNYRSVRDGFQRTDKRSLRESESQFRRRSMIHVGLQVGVVQCRYERQMPMVIVVVQSIADDEAIGDLEAVVVGLDVDLGLASLPKKDCRPNAAWAVTPNRRQQCGQSVTRVKNVVDQKDRAIVDIR